jgi:hypothetical protein
MRRAVAIFLAVGAVLADVSAASAAYIVGTNGDDVLTGTVNRGTVNRDTVHARGGNDTVTGPATRPRIARS